MMMTQLSGTSPRRELRAGIIYSDQESSTLDSNLFRRINSLAAQERNPHRRALAIAASRSTTIGTSTDPVESNVLYDRQNSQFSLAWRIRNISSEWTLWEGEIREQQRGFSLVIGERDLRGHLHPKGHAVLRGSHLMFWLKDKPNFACSVDANAPYLQPLRSAEPAKKTHRPRAFASQISDSTIFSTPELNKLRLAPPLTELASFEPTEVEDGLTVEDLARLRGEIPMEHPRERMRG